MKIIESLRVCLCLLLLIALSASGFAQRNRKPVIFAVIQNGTALEPIAFVEKGKLTAAVNGADDQSLIANFNKIYYKPKSSYRLIFGGANAGTVSVVKSDSTAECSRNMADVTVASTKTKLNGFVMALATDAVPKKTSSGVRRRPTAAEKTEIETLVRAEFANQKVSAAVRKNIHSQNLTALDVDNDKRPDFVGSYWVDTGKTSRGLLFFIAEKDEKGKYRFGYIEYRTIKQDEVMSGEISTVDEGTLHEVLLDAFDYDDDGVSEIFTYTPSFEGAGFNVYKVENGSWKKEFEVSNYHCGY